VEVNHKETVFPGVSVGWVDLSGLTPEEAGPKLMESYGYPQHGRLVFRDGENVWVAAPMDLGMYFSPQENAQKAYEVGRSGSIVQRLAQQYQTWTGGANLTPSFWFDEATARAYLHGLAAEIDQPTIEADLQINGVEVMARSGQTGRTLDVEATLASLQTQLSSLQDGEIPLVVHETPPEIMDVSDQAEIARTILSKPLRLTVPGSDQEPYVFMPEDLAEMLAIERVVENGAASYQVRLGTEDLQDYLEQVADSLRVTPENPRFIFDDESGELEVIRPAVIGEELDVEASLAAVQNGLREGNHNINLDMAYTDPQVTDDATAASLGITENIYSYTSYFYGSDAGRIQNIATASSRFHGVLVAPGDTFSMASVLGDVSLDNGYEEAWIIYGDRTIKGVGGGVCQVSTTLFRTVFFSGLQIDERHPHAYRVYYYEQTASGGHDTSLAGLDATVYVPLVDFKFTNDTGNWLLMETYVNEGGRSLTWKFYSTADGRAVDWTTTGLTDKTDPPEPLYVENNDLSKGEIKQVDWAVEGASVVVTRSVSRDGTTLSEDAFSTQYMPWKAVCEYGPGTKGMPPKDPDENDPCSPDTKKSNN
jgi:vancomycin resistance protein YoaR